MGKPTGQVGKLFATSGTGRLGIGFLFLLCEDVALLFPPINLILGVLAFLFQNLLKALVFTQELQYWTNCSDAQTPEQRGEHGAKDTENEPATIRPSAA